MVVAADEQEISSGKELQQLHAITQDGESHELQSAQCEEFLHAYSFGSRTAWCVREIWRSEQSVHQCCKAVLRNMSSTRCLLRGAF